MFGLSAQISAWGIVVTVGLAINVACIASEIVPVLKQAANGVTVNVKVTDPVWAVSGLYIASNLSIELGSKDPVPFAVHSIAL